MDEVKKEMRKSLIALIGSVILTISSLGGSWYHQDRALDYAQSEEQIIENRDIIDYHTYMAKVCAVGLVFGLGIAGYGFYHEYERIGSGGTR